MPSTELESLTDVIFKQSVNCMKALWCNFGNIRCITIIIIIVPER